MNPNYLNKFPYNILLDDELSERIGIASITDNFIENLRFNYFVHHFKSTNHLDFQLSKETKLTNKICFQLYKKILYLVLVIILLIFGIILIKFTNSFAIFPVFFILIVSSYYLFQVFVISIVIEFETNKLIIKQKNYYENESFEIGYEQIKDALIILRNKNSNNPGNYLVLIDNENVCYKFKIDQLDIGLVAYNIDKRFSRKVS